MAVVDFPGCAFYLFGMGNRRKLLYRERRLLDLSSGRTVYEWDVVEEAIHPAEYIVRLRTRNDQEVRISEDEEGVWLEEGGDRQCLTEGALSLPRFEGHREAALLHALHQEVLINIVDGRPLPNLLVYSKPWYRDAAMMLLCLEKTGNAGLIEAWVRSLRDPFDHNNGGHCEPDNLGQALYLVSALAGPAHPIVPRVLEEVPRFRRGRHIVGLTDFAEHPVYQTKWLKYGLRALGLDDPYEIPSVFDSYSSLFWMDYKDEHVEGPGFPHDALENYPYLGWAEAHFHKWPARAGGSGDPPARAGDPPARGNEMALPLTWEAHASEAEYGKMAVVSEEYAARRLAAPHSWHAAEMFLYYWDCGGQPT